MLLIEGKYHPKFNYGSSSLKLRSGVGILPNQRIIFIISDQQNVNFFEFSSIFNDLFGSADGVFFEQYGSRTTTTNKSVDCNF
jgi:uncharacterized protein YigE (DUF2233 family)